jgi:hypothetical protein
MRPLKSRLSHADTADVAPDDGIENGLATAIGVHHAMDALARDDQAPTDPGPGDDDVLEGEEGETIEAIKARLAARGLLVQGPAIVVPRGDRPEKAVVLDDVLIEAEGDHHPNAVPEDDWDVPSEGGPSVSVRCPQCRGTQQTPVDVTRFRCLTCARAWRWAVCHGCDELAFTVERQESWRCGCGHFSRSWWRTDTAARDGLIVVARRRDLAARAEREEIRAGMRKRRWKIIAFAVVGLIAVMGFVVKVQGSETTPAAGTAETCRLFDRLRSDLGSGTLTGEELSAKLAAIGEAASIADPAVHDPALELVAVGSPNKAAFLVAQTNLADGCAAFQAKR